jgi:hypothetical protein
MTPRASAESPAIRAARWLLSAQQQWSTRLERARRNNRDIGPKPSLRFAEKQFGASKTSISRHLNALKATGRPALSSRPVGHPPVLTPDEDRALVAYIRYLAATGPFPGKKRIENAANALLARRGRRPASHMWYKRWKKTHEEELREIITSVSAGGAVEGSGPESAERFEDINEFLDKVYLVDAGVRDGEGDANGSVDGLDELTADVSQTGEGVANAPNPGAEGFITGSDGNFGHIRPYPPESTGSRPLSPS